ncbi:beta-1,6-N-acetylglucosaminyltransferase [Tellurirhabdus bombi]|uniref:beta-1,6-N-acetylglucosaminyltransferase n=1 Tax=Tellurirhabdus bombi TaxID=2907205 RepID=UPI001F1A8C48|nr:beta-1,6-N-acetylglucosaminyltransferase [Tellurirhabdus bombi]
MDSFRASSAGAKLSPRLVYLLLVHTLPQQCRRLIERLQSSASTFWVHVDAKSDQSVFCRELQGLPVRFVQKRYHAQWGRYTFVEAKLAGIQEIIDSQQLFDQLIILSGQDYPLVSSEAISTHFSAYPNCSFVHHVPITQLEANMHDRVSKYHFYLPLNRAIIYPYDNGGWLKKRINAAIRLSGQFPLPRPALLGYPFYFGSNWVRLSWKATNYLLKKVASFPEIATFFRRTLVSDEFFFQTLLLNASEEERGIIINSNCTFTHWNRPPEAYQTPLSMNDLESSLTSQCLFARKFNELYDKKLLTWLDQHHN